MKPKIELVYNKKKTSNIALICVNFNQKELISKYVEKIKNQTLVPDIIVLENRSNDGSFEHLKKEFPDITIVKAKSNYGGAGGYYLAEKYAYEMGYEHIMFGENDAFPVSRDMIATLFKHSSNDKKAMFTARNKTKPGVIGGIFHATMMHRDVIKQIGYVYPGYFFRGDDLEYALRIRKKGIKWEAVGTYYTHPTDEEVKSLIPIHFSTRNELQNYFIYNNPFNLFKRIYLRIFVALSYFVLFRDSIICSSIWTGIWDFISGRISLEKSMKRLNSLKKQKIKKHEFKEEDYSFDELRKGAYSRYYFFTVGSLSLLLNIREGLLKYTLKRLKKEKLGLFKKKAFSTGYGTPSIMLCYFFNDCNFIKLPDSEKKQIKWDNMVIKSPKILRIAEFVILALVSFIISLVFALYKTIRIDQKIRFKNMIESYK